MATTSAVLLLRPRVPHLVARPGRLAAGLAAGDAGRAARASRAGGWSPARWPGSRRTTSCWCSCCSPASRSGSRWSARAAAAVAVRLGRRGAHRRRRPAERGLPADPRPAAAPDGAGAVGEQRRRRAGQHVGPAARAARAAAGGDLGRRAAGAVARPPGAVLRGRVRGGRALHVRLRRAAALPGLHPADPVRRRHRRDGATSRPGLGGPVRAQRRGVARARAAADAGRLRRRDAGPRRQPARPGLHRLAGVRPPGHRGVRRAAGPRRTPPCSPPTTARPGAAPLPAGRPGLQRPERALRPGPAARRRHDGGRRRRPVPRGPRRCSTTAGARPARQRRRRRQRGAGSADRRLHRPDRVRGPCCGRRLHHLD